LTSLDPVLDTVTGRDHGSSPRSTRSSRRPIAFSNVETELVDAEEQ
jgi:hypothetical protein